MKQNVILKMFPNGISIHMDPELPFEELCDCVKEKFLEADSFFKGASVALSFEGRELTEAQEKELVKIIVSVSSVNILCIVGKDNDKNKLYVKAIKQAQSLEKRDDALVVNSSLKNGDIVESKKHVIIVGDIYPGCAVSSAKDIIVFGGIYGEAYAGVPDEELPEESLKKHYILSFDLAPEKLIIDEVRFVPEKKGKWLMKPKFTARISTVENGSIHSVPISKETLDSLIQ